MGNNDKQFFGDQGNGTKNFRDQEHMNIFRNKGFY